MLIYAKKQNLVLYNNQEQDIYLGSNETPYLPIVSIFKDVFEYTTQCNKNRTECTIQSKPKGFTLSINTIKKNISSSINGNIQIFPIEKKDYIISDNNIWVSYKILEKIVPAKFSWYADRFVILMEPSELLPVLSLIKRYRHSQQQKILAQQKAQEKIKELLNNPYYSSTQFNSELQYELRTQANFNYGNNSSRNIVQYLSINSNSKIWKGNLNLSGSTSFGNKSNFFNNIYGNFFNELSNSISSFPGTISWRYEINNSPPYFNRLAIGDVAGNSNLFFTSVPFKNGILYDRLGNYNPALEFYHEGFAMPRTEIEMYRGALLLNIFFVNSSGKYIVRDVNASPGDVYTLKFYYPNGETNEESFVFAPTGNIIKKNQFDIQAVYGEVDQQNSLLNDNKVLQSVIRYGLLNNLTLGLGVLNTPNTINNNQNKNTTIPYIDLAVQPINSISITSGILLRGQGYVIQGVSNFIPKNFLKIYYHNVDSSHPLLKFVDFSAIDTPRLLDISNTTYLFNNWRWFNQYINNPYQQQVNTNLSTYINPWLAPTIGLKYYKSTQNSINTYLYNLANSFSYGDNFSSVINLNGNFKSINAQNIIASYRYNRNWIYNINLTRAKDETQTKYNYAASLNWTPTLNWSVSAYASKESAYVTLSYTNAVGLFSNLKKPTDYGMGTVYGTIRSPIQPDGSTYPLEGVKMKVGGNSTFTDKSGKYHLSGVPVNQTVLLEIDEDTVDPSYLAQKSKIPIYLQPTDIMKFDPSFKISVGFDGTVFSNKILPKKLEIQVRNQKTHATQNYLVEPTDGFFYVPAIPPGQYSITLVDVKQPPKPLLITITEKDEWLSDLELFWQQD